MVLLMGYGLVEVPRYVWDLSRREHRLRRTYFQVAKLHSEKSDATETLEDILDVCPVSVVPSRFYSANLIFVSFF